MAAGRWKQARERKREAQGPGRPVGKSSFVPDRLAERRYVKEGLSVADCLEVRLHSLSCSSQSPSSLLSSFSCSFDDEKKYPRVASPPAPAGRIANQYLRFCGKAKWNEDSGKI